MKRESSLPTRHIWVLVHRYVGLFMALFLIVVGLTGSLLAFYGELERTLNPQFVVAETSGPRLDAASLVEKAESFAPRARVEALWLGDRGAAAQVAMSARTDPATGQPFRLGFDHLALDPFTGAVLGQYTWGAIGESWTNLMAFVYKLHYTLALDEAGSWILGIVALVWTIDCFVAFYLTLPPVPRKSRDLSVQWLRRFRFSASIAPRTFWKRWKPAWQVKWRGSATRINFDLHRAGGLWLWAMLLIFAWSSVYMNLGPVYTRVTQLVLDYQNPWKELPERDTPLERPALDWRRAETLGRELMTRAPAEHGFRVESPVSLRVDRTHGVYVYQVRSSLDIGDRYGETRVFFDADTGEQRLLSLPSGQHAGNTVTAWLFALHTAKVFGLPYRILVCLLGFAIVMLAATGIVIWLQKRRAGRLHLQRGRGLPRLLPVRNGEKP